MTLVADVAQLLGSAATLLVAWGALRQARAANYHARRVDHAVNGRPEGATISDDVSSIEARGVRDDQRRGHDPPTRHPPPTTE